MALSLPLSFQSCFFSKHGLDVLHDKITASTQENTVLLAYFRARSTAIRSTGQDLFNSLPSPEELAKSFDHDAEAGPPSSFKSAFLGSVLRDTHAQAQLYRRVGIDLDRKLIEPFENWSSDHLARISDARRNLEKEYLQPYEKGLNDLRKARDAYESKCIKLEEEEEEARFNGNSAVSSAPSSPGSASTSPPLQPTTKKLPALAIPANVTFSSNIPHSPQALMSPAQDTPVAESAQAQTEDDGNHTLEKLEQEDGQHLPLKRKLSVADRLKALTRDPKAPKAEVIEEVPEEEESTAAPSEPAGPQIIQIVNLSNGAREWSSLFTRAHKDLPKRSLKIPIIGTYTDVHSGEDLVTYFTEHLMGLESNRDRAYEFVRVVVEELQVMRLVGELGNEFRDTSDSYYQFKEDASQLDSLHAPKPAAAIPLPLSPTASDQSTFQAPVSTMLKRSNTLISSLTSALAPSSPSARLTKARQEASLAATNYKSTVKRVDFLRINADQQTELYLNYLQRAELDRLHFMKQTLARYLALVEPLEPVSLSRNLDQGKKLLEAIQPEADLQNLCKLYRVTTGYRPQPVVFQDHYGSELPEQNFGIDLVKWSEICQNSNGKEPQDVGIPPVLVVLLAFLKDGYGKVEKAADRRRVWYLDVPLGASHRLRTALNDARAPGGVPSNLLKQSDLPTVAAAVKLWLLELDSPPVPFMQYDDLKQVYKSAPEATDEERIAQLKEILLRIPKVHLEVLAAVVSHLKALVEETREEDGESDEVYLTKLGLSVGRCLLRPKMDSSLTLNDRTSAHLLSDLVRLYNQLLPLSISARGQREKERWLPKRKRTAPVDMRLSRSKVNGKNADEYQGLLEEQLHQRDGSATKSGFTEKGELPALPESTIEKTQAPEDPPFDPPIEEQESLQVSAEKETVAPFLTPVGSHTPLPDLAPAISAPQTEVPVEQTPRLSESRSRKVEDAPFAIPTEASPIPKRSSRVMDAPFVPPSEPQDAPFEAPIDEDVPLSSSGGLSRSSTGDKPLLGRSTRVVRGPRPVSGSPVAGRPLSGNVASLASRFGS